MNQESKGKRLQFWIGILISVLCIAAILLIIKPGDIWVVIQSHSLAIHVERRVGRPRGR